MYPRLYKYASLVEKRGKGQVPDARLAAGTASTVCVIHIPCDDAVMWGICTLTWTSATMS